MLRLPLALLLATLIGCDSGVGSAQRLFDDQALLARPDGYTQIEIVDGVVRVVSEDADDWRLGPAFGVNTQIIQRPVPNPVRPREQFTLTLFTDGLAGGMALYRLNARGDLLLIEDRPEAELQGIYSFTLSGDRVDDGVDGLYRIAVLDGRSRVVTYGDVLVVE